MAKYETTFNGCGSTLHVLLLAVNSFGSREENSLIQVINAAIPLYIVYSAFSRFLKMTNFSENSGTMLPAAIAILVESIILLSVSRQRVKRAYSNIQLSLVVGYFNERLRSLDSALSKKFQVGPSTRFPTR